MNLIIDVGNTRIKTAVFIETELIHSESFTQEKFLTRIYEIIKIYNCKNGILAAVRDMQKSQLEKLHTLINLIELNGSTEIPFINLYATPKTLGADRMALAAAAVRNFPNKDVLIIDAGTCITYDFLDSEGCYHGGAISPGIKMRYKSLHAFTENLPLLEPESTHPLIGNSTETSMHSGVMNGVINEIDTIIEQYRKKNKDLTVVLTGGDVNFLSNKLKNGIFANPNFLMEGLNAILIHNLI